MLFAMTWIVAFPVAADESVDRVASVRCEGLLRERQAIVSEPGRASRDAKLVQPLGSEIRDSCLGPGIDPAIRGKALLEVAMAAGPEVPETERRALLAEARGLLEQAAPRSREQVLVLEQLATLSAEFPPMESESLLQQALRLREEIYGAKSRKAFLGRYRLVAYFRFRGTTEAEQRADLPLARECAERFVRGSVELFGEGDPATVFAWSALADIVRELEGSEAADQLLEDHVYPYGTALTAGIRLALLID